MGPGRRGVLGALGGRGAQEVPGVPRSQCQGAPEAQAGQAGLGRSHPWDPESQGALAGQGGQAHWSRRSHRPRARLSPLSVQRPRGHPSPPSTRRPAAAGPAGTALGVRAGPLLLCHPSVQEVPGILAIPGVQGGQTPRMRCCRRQESRGGPGALGAQVGQADPSRRIPRWHLPAPPSPLSIRSSRGDPAVQGSRSLPCALAAHMGPGVLESQAHPWLPSGPGTLLSRRG